MALFSKEAEKNARSEPSPKFQPQTQPISLSGPATVTGAGEKSTVPPASSAAVPAGHAYLDGGSKISGKLSFDGPTKIDGQVDGEITAKESIAIGESAIVTAQIKAGSVIVAGKVSGDISATQRIEIRPSAKVLGNLTAPVLVVHEGALFEGHCSMQPEGARDERRVTVFPKDERLAQAGGQKQA